jgi:hypothetical protein
MIWVDWHLGQFIELTEILQGSDLKFTITMHYYRLWVASLTIFGKNGKFSHRECQFVYHKVQ